MKNVLLLRIDNGIKKYLTPVIRRSIFNFISGMIYLFDFHLLRRAKGGFNQMKYWPLSNKINTFETLNNFLGY